MSKLKENKGMKKAIKVLLVSLVAATLLTACGKAPVEELNTTKGSIDAVVGEGAEQYTPDELKAVNDKLATAMAEIKVQEGKFFKNFDAAKAQLAQVKVEAEALKGKVVQRKEELKAAANNALTDAQAAVAEAKALLEMAPQGKGSLADIEAMKSDAAGLETELENVPAQIESGEFVAATEKALAVAATAMGISNDIRTAQEKLASVKK
jgi:major membrane immunogen (membrane-anchored lipoprotein)